MKKLLSIAVCASAVAAFATDVTCGSVGVTAITSSFTNTIVAVSYKDLASDADITISNIVKTANLTAGDLLHVFKDSGTYETYTLTDNGSGVLYWAKTQNYVIGASGGLTVGTSADASITTLESGLGLWLVRTSGWTGSSFTFYIYGKPSDTTSVTVGAGKTALIGNPTQTGKAPTVTSAVKGDRILVPDEDRKGDSIETTTYTYTGTVWNTIKIVDGERKRIEGLPSIPAGMGFWYISKGESDVRVAW